MSEPIGFVHRFRDLLRGAGVRCAITSGMACVHYGLQQTTKDTDWVVDPAHLDRLRQVLTSLQAAFPPWIVRYRTVFGAPLEPEWMANGWTSHIEIREDALGFDHHLDFFARPPRVVHWDADEDGFVSRDVVARMKRTDRDRDWPIVDGLGWQIADSEGGLDVALQHVQDARRLRELWNRAPVGDRAAAVAQRPLLGRIEHEGDDLRLEGWIRLERLAWQCLNRERHGRYQSAWKDFYRRWRREADWEWPTAETFALQHRRLVAAASRCDLPKVPVPVPEAAGLRERAISAAATIAFVAVDVVRQVTPPVEVMLP
jgi:hypothetical protein